MSSYLIYTTIAFILAAFATYIILPLLIKKCYDKGFFDMPDERKVHKNQIPRLGGVVLVPCALIGFFISINLLPNIDRFPIIKTSTLLIGSGLAVIYVLGIFDDIFGLSAKFKFLIQLLAVIILPACQLCITDLYGLFGLTTINYWVGFGITIFVCLTILNAINMIDGIDGLCTGLSAIALIVFTYYFFVCNNYIFAFFAIALIGTLLVYSFYNMWGSTAKRTKTFMGDAGSLTIGFILCYFGLKLSVPSAVTPPPAEGIMIPISVLALPILDLARVSIFRIKNGVGPFHPDKTHIHHIFLSRGYSQHMTLCYILGIDCCIIAATLILVHLGVNNNITLLVDIVIYSSVMLWLTKQQKKEQAVEILTNAQPVETVDKTMLESYPSTNLSNDDICISIVVATYNSAETLRDTLESILHQTYPNYEVVLCDGKSKDNTMDIVNEYMDKFNGRLKPVSEPDKGLYDAMNKGIDRATGDIVGILNSDDFYTSNDILQNIIDTFKGMPLLEAVYGDIHYVDPKDLTRPVRYYSSRLFRPRYMRLGFMPAHPSFYCLRQLYIKYGKFDTQYKVAADFEQLFRLLYINRIRAQYIPKDFVTMRTGGASNSGMSSHKQIMHDHVHAIRSYGVSANVPMLSIRYIFKAIEVISSKIKYSFM